MELQSVLHEIDLFKSELDALRPLSVQHLTKNTCKIETLCYN